MTRLVHWIAIVLFCVSPAWALHPAIGVLVAILLLGPIGLMWEVEDNEEIRTWNILAREAYAELKLMERAE